MDDRLDGDDDLNEVFANDNVIYSRGTASATAQSADDYDDGDDDDDVDGEDEDEDEDEAEDDGRSPDLRVNDGR